MLETYWNQAAAEILAALDSSGVGLSSAEASIRLARDGKNTLKAQHRLTLISLFLDKLRSPLLLLLIAAALISIVVHDWVDAAIVLAIVMLSGVLSTIQEYHASSAVEKLRQRISVRTTVLRDGTTLEIPMDEVVIGDIIMLNAGDLIPADGLVLEAKDFFISQALLTGETYPVEKKPGIADAQAGLSERNNCVFMGTSVRSGTARVVIVRTASDTAFGQIADSLTLRPPETEFERGVRRFGTLLMWVMVLVVLAVIAINTLLHRPPVETLLFAMALAIGLSPELLPAILSITLSRGAQHLAKHGVIVRRLNAIENLGSMDVLCTDKTGTLTKGVVQLDSAVDIHGQTSEQVMFLAYLNSSLQTGLSNALDQAVIDKATGLDGSGYTKLDEIPYDFVRKRLSIVVSEHTTGVPLMVTKGALENILQICEHVQNNGQIAPLDESAQQQIRERYASWSEQGFRVLGIARKEMPAKPTFTREDEYAMVFVGFLLFFDPPEEGVQKTLADLRKLGVHLKVITGDNHLVARHVAQAVGMKVSRIITGSELSIMKDEALWNLAPKVNLFAEVDPNQKERIILALQKRGHVVGYLGDGINDAPSLHAADVGISVDQAVDVAKEAADIVLLEHELDVVRQGIDEGRHTFANTLKYIFITTSANFGNMISMALASLFLPFLPMLAKQILLNNLLSDIPAMGIAGDRVDREWEQTPHRWDIRQIRNFMFSFGLISTIFDIITFGVLLYLAGESAELFRTGWFVESLLTELAILFVIRTYKPFYQSRPGRLLTWSALAIALLTLAIPYLPVAALFGFVPLPAEILLLIILITVLYILISEWTKHGIYRRIS